MESQKEVCDRSALDIFPSDVWILIVECILQNSQSIYTSTTSQDTTKRCTWTTHFESFLFTVMSLCNTCRTLRRILKHKHVLALYTRTGLRPVQFIDILSTTLPSLAEHHDVHNRLNILMRNAERLGALLATDAPFYPFHPE